MRPETACLLRAAYVGEASLRFSLVDDKLRHMDGLHKTHEAIQLHASHRDQDLVKRVYEALKRAPWTLTRSYLEKVQSGFLVWSGLGLYVKIGAAPSFSIFVCIFFPPINSCDNSNVHRRPLQVCKRHRR